MSNAPELTTISQSLLDLGLGQNEAVLYEILLKTADATIPELTKNSPFSRTMLYYILQSLEGYGLLETKKIGKKTTYNAAPPEKLAEMIEEREKEFKKQKGLLHNVMGDLYSTYRLAHNQPGVKFFEGEEGIKEVWWDSLNSKTEIYTYGDLEFLTKHFSALNENYLKERLKLGLMKKAITNDSAFNRDFLSKYDSNLTETRLATGSTLAFHSVIMQIYDGKISYTTLAGEALVGVIISDKFIYEMQKNLFEYHWSILK